MKKQIHIPNSQLRRPVSIEQAQANRNLTGRDLWHLPNALRAELPNLPGELVKAAETHRRQPGILDRIKLCQSSEEAYTLFHTFLDSANSVSQKTINRARRLLETLDFPLP